MAYKRILTIQDISCVGQCSMTVALPILSACGHETCILPTAVLSTHTGGFGRPVVTHLDEGLNGMWQHWQQQGITFDAIYTGYLGSVAAVETAIALSEQMLAPGGVLIVDPAMADHGKRYSGLDEAYAAAMAELCEKADVLIPNLTEAAMLSGTEYREDMDEACIYEMLDKLHCDNIILTGTAREAGMTGVTVKQGSKRYSYSHPRVDRNFHGTGDMFAAAFVGALMQEKTMERSVQIASDYVLRCVELTAKEPAHWYGVRFESVLGELIQMLKE